MQHSTPRRDAGGAAAAQGSAAEGDGRGGGRGSLRARTDSWHSSPPPGAVPAGGHHASNSTATGRALPAGANTSASAGAPGASTSLPGAAPQKPSLLRASPKRSSRSTSTPALGAGGTRSSTSLGNLGLAGPGESSSPHFHSAANVQLGRAAAGCSGGSSGAWVEQSPSSSPSYLHSSLIMQPFALTPPAPAPSFFASLLGSAPMQRGSSMRKSSSASSFAPPRRSSLFGPSSLPSAFASMPSFQAPCPPSSRKGRSRVCVFSIVSTVLLLFCTSLFLPFTFQAHRPAPAKQGSAWEPQNRIETQGTRHYKPTPPTPLFASETASGRLLYGIIIDAGSSGTRIHVFPYRMPPPSASPTADGGMEQGGDEEESGEAGPLSRPPLLPLFERDHHTLKVRPGLSSYGHDPEAAGQSLHPLLEFAKSKVPREAWHATPIRLMATAGLRRMEPGKAQSILEACTQRLHASGFHTPASAAPPAAPGAPGAPAHSHASNMATIIPGTWEGVYAWVSANYAAGTLGADPRDTVGIIEMGGASAQVTFVPPVPPPKPFAVDLAIPGMRCTLYSHSFLGLGQEAALSATQAFAARGSSALRWQGGAEGPWNPCEPIPLGTQTARTTRQAGVQAGTQSSRQGQSLLLANAGTSPDDSRNTSHGGGIALRRGARGHIGGEEGGAAERDPGRSLVGAGAQRGSERQLLSYPQPTAAASGGGNFSLCREMARLVIGAAEALQEGAPGSGRQMAFAAGEAAGLAAAASISRAPCPYSRCPVNGTFVPELTGAFLATENFHYTARFLRLRPSATLAEFADAATAVCERKSRRRARRTGVGAPPSSARPSTGTAGEELEDAGVGPVELAKYCFAASYAVAFLHDGLGVSLHDTRLRFTNYVKGRTVDWALGAMIIDILNSAGRPLLHQEVSFATTADGDKDSAALAKASAYVSLWSSYNGAGTLVFAVCCFIAFALWSFNDFLRPAASTMYDVEKGRLSSGSSRSQTFRAF